MIKREIVGQDRLLAKLHEHLNMFARGDHDADEKQLESYKAQAGRNSEVSGFLVLERASDGS